MGKTSNAKAKPGTGVAEAKSGKTQTPKFRRRAAARPNEVLDAALELFLEKGFAATRVEDIATRAGISKGLVYQYFPSKQALIEGLVKRALSPVTAEALKMVTSFEGDPRTVITMILAMLAVRFRDPKILAIPKLIMREAVSFPEIARMYRTQILDAAMPVLAGLIGRGVREGYFRQVDPELTLRSVMGPIVAHIFLSEIFGVEPEGGLFMEKLMHNHVDILFDGLSLPVEKADE